MKLIFDVGMFDASDTRYYLDEGYSVVAVEANPALVERASADLKDYVDSGKLIVLNAAIGEGGGLAELTVCGDDLGSSTMYKSAVQGRIPIGTFTVPLMTTSDLFEKYGIPHYLKVDIEGADSLCVREVAPDKKPEYISFEIGEEFESLLSHVVASGYSKFKIIDQTNFREISRDSLIADRMARKLVRLAGFAEPQYVRRLGRYFRLGHSSGPAPWCSDGTWESAETVLERWSAAVAGDSKRNVWYDLHAS